MKLKYLSFLALLAVISCSSDGLRQVEEAPYRTSGIEQYFLPELPNWANFSQAGNCIKSNSIQYLDFSKLKSSYQLSYQQMIELQAQYNIRREDYFRTTALKFLKPVEEATFFSNALEQVKSGLRHFKLPNVQEVDVIWLEGILKVDTLSNLIKFSRSEEFNQRPVILFSSCLSSQRLTQWVEENELDSAEFYLLSSEWLSPYGSDFILKPGLKLELNMFLGEGIKISIKGPKEWPEPIELIR